MWSKQFIGAPAQFVLALCEFQCEGVAALILRALSWSLRKVPFTLHRVPSERRSSCRCRHSRCRTLLHETGGTGRREHVFIFQQKRQWQLKCCAPNTLEHTEAAPPSTSMTGPTQRAPPFGRRDCNSQRGSYLATSSLHGPLLDTRERRLQQGTSLLYVRTPRAGLLANNFRRQFLSRAR